MMDDGYTEIYNENSFLTQWRKDFGKIVSQNYRRNGASPRNGFNE